MSVMREGGRTLVSRCNRRMRYLFVFGAALTMSGAALAQQSALPAQVRADIALTEITDAIRDNKPVVALEAIQRYRSLGVTVPPRLLFVEARLALIASEPIRAESAISEYLRTATTADPSYSDAVRLYPEIGRQAQHAKEQLAINVRREIPARYLAQAVLTPFRICESCPEMIKLPAGSVSLGEHQDGPSRTITFDKSFAIGRYEVTLGDWRKCVRAAACPNEKTAYSQFGDQFPVLDVSRNDALAYTAWLSKETGLAFRLPSISEWTYAAKGGTAFRYYVTDNLSDICRFGNFGTIRETVPLAIKWNQDALRWNQNQSHKEAKLLMSPKITCYDSGGVTSFFKAGSFQANGFGFYDILGNAAEILEDCQPAKLDDIPANGQPYKIAGCSNFVAAGGGYMDSESEKIDSFLISEAILSWHSFYNLSFQRGFRIAL